MINDLIGITQQAGNRVMSLYDQAHEVIMIKEDRSLLTAADMASHEFICAALKTRYPSIPVISEESSTLYDYETRKNWEYFFLVDPLDGTREFIKRNGEFTINIALIREKMPVLGIIHAPAQQVTYYAESKKGAYKMENGNTARLPLNTSSDRPCHIVLSRSHGKEKNDDLLKKLQSSGKDFRILSIGSALKFGLVAEGKADIYARFTPTMEWDTAAGQVIVNETGKKIIPINEIQELMYNKPDLVNPEFIVR